MKLFIRRDRKAFRTENRRVMNDVEVKLWNHLRKNQLGYRFRRQHSIGPYIVDFYCPSHALVIEIDGDTHYEPGSVDYDHRRDDFLRSHSLNVIRFTNFDVRHNLQGVIDSIIHQLSESGAATPSNSPLERGRTVGKGI